MTDKLIYTGGPAFPSGDGQFGGGPNHEHGMTLRDWFAGQALQAYIIQLGARSISAASYQDECVTEAYEFADAMLEARRK